MVGCWHYLRLAERLLLPGAGMEILGSCTVLYDVVHDPKQVTTVLRHPAMHFRILSYVHVGFLQGKPLMWAGPGREADEL